MDLRKISTEELVKELRSRKGVKELIAEPYQLCEIKIREEVVMETGPAIILVVID